jgi:tRNA threonylcarbamoyladenosine biosynthesis protein TsaB
MLLLSIRTDKPEAEIGLFDGDEKIGYVTWQAHRQLAETLHIKIRELLKSQKRELHDIQGMIVFKGPGSFTGLRIGISVANALADGLNIPVVAGNGDDWLKASIRKIQKGENDEIALPKYGSPPHVTRPKH